MHRDTRNILAAFDGHSMADQMEKRLNSPVLYRDLPKQLAAANEPVRRMVAAIATNMTRTDLAVSALVELLAEKGVFTLDEYNDMEASVTQRFMEAVNPAQEAAQESAGDKKVERLVEPAGAPPLIETETVSRGRLVEG